MRIDFYAKYSSVHVLILVNVQVALIFKRVFEIQKLAQNGKILTGIGAFETRRFAFTMAVLTMTGAYAKRTAR
jgi:hypothetical protein